MTVSDTLPSSATFASATPSQGAPCSQAVGVVTCDIGNLASGAVATVAIDVTPNTASIISNAASVSGDQVDPDPTDDSDTELTQVGPSADLSIAMTDSPDPAFTGYPLSYELAVANAGPSATTGVQVADTLPAGASFVSATPSQGSCSQAGGVVSCSLGAMADGANATIQVEVTAPTPMVDSVVSSSTSVRSDAVDPDPSDDSDSEDTVLLIPYNLGIEGGDSPDPVFVGATLTYLGASELWPRRHRRDGQ